MGHTTIDKFGRLTLFSFFALFPILFVPFTENYYDTHKWILLIVASITIFLLWTANCVRQKRIVFSLTRQSIAGVSLLASAVVSFLLASSNKVEALTHVFGLMTYASVAVLMALGPTFFQTKTVLWLRWILMSTAGLLGLIALYQFFGLGKAVFPDTPFIADHLWTPIGSSLALASIFAIALPMTIGMLIETFRHKAETHAALIVVIALLLISGFVVTVKGMFPLFSQSVLPISSGWTILLEGLKDPKQALSGVGAENFISAFAAGRPVSLNLGPLWNIRFSTSATFVFHILSTFGLTSIVGMAILLYSLVWRRIQRTDSPAHIGLTISLYATAFILLFTPPNLSVLLYLAGVLLVLTPISSHIHIPVNGWKLFPAAIIVMAISILWVIGALVAVQVYLGEYHYYRSLTALQARNGSAAYQELIRATQSNSSVTKYHIGLSQTSLGVANALSREQASPSAQISATNQEQITKLIQQSVDEAKRATQLSPKSPVVWEYLASVYSVLSPVIKGADLWAIAAYQQAIQLDPTNPILRLSIGGIFVGQQRYDRARDMYATAIALKPDYANAHYNLAFAYAKLNVPLNQAIELARTAKLVAPASQDKKQLDKELEEIKKVLTKDELAALNRDDDTFLPAPPGSSPSGTLLEVAGSQESTTPKALQ